ncbi:MAG TPA: YfiR family protein, partial [Hyphomicrobiaceae bacterium]|nr:YfiR family protein [Hyphomicrobiaceae bacterium]
AGADALGRRYLRGKPIVTRRVNHRELADCAILYIAASDGPRIRDLVLAVRGTGVLTVSDAPGAALEGAVIGLSMTDQRIVFDVNVKEARRNNLVISAKLLSLAQAVVEAP